MWTAVVQVSPARGALQRIATPQSAASFMIDIEGRFVELDDVHAIGLQRQRFLVQQLGEGERHLRRLSP